MKDKAVIRVGGGCFWCIEAEFKRLSGVLQTQCGYEGGTTENPTYEEVCSGRTGHAEALQITYDPTLLSLEDLLHHFLTRAHDPTQVNGQGVDLGTQYRSVIFYADNAEREAAQKAIQNAARHWPDAIATTLEPHKRFWPAEEGHQNYYERYEARTGQPHVRALYKRRKWASE